MRRNLPLPLRWGVDTFCVLLFIVCFFRGTVLVNCCRMAGLLCLQGDCAVMCDCLNRPSGILIIFTT